VKILVEMMSAEYGGIRTYVEHLLGTWERTHPEDELLVMLPTTSTVPTFGHKTHRVRVPRPDTIFRPAVQTLTTQRLAKGFGADAVLATLPSTSLLQPKVPTGIVIYDLRHELRPEQFSRSKRLVRGISYGRGYQTADGVLSISRRSLDDLHELHPRTRRLPSTVTHLGADHVRSWTGTPRSGTAITFAHHTNKNQDLVLDAWAHAVSSGLEPPHLTMLGVGSARDRISARVAELGLTGHVTLAPFLPEPEFQQVFASASMIVFPSDFEGFGLPVVEGMLLGVPVVIGPERATMEIAGGHAVVLEEWSAAALAHAVARADRLDDAQLAAAREHAATFTWARCVDQTRDFLASLATSR